MLPGSLPGGAACERRGASSQARRPDESASSRRFTFGRLAARGRQQFITKPVDCSQPQRDVSCEVADATAGGSRGGCDCRQGERCMSIAKICSAAAVTALVATAAWPQQAAPSVIGKTCRGTFQVSDQVSGKASLGGFQIRFAGTPDKPTAHLWRGFGQAAWQKIEREVDSGTLSSDVTGFTDLGEARNLQIGNGQVTFTTRQGAGISLVYSSTTPSIIDGAALISTQAAGEPAGRLDWRSANTHILCR
jgi:hypothetical protein